MFQRVRGKIHRIGGDSVSDSISVKQVCSVPVRVYYRACGISVSFRRGNKREGLYRFNLMEIQNSSGWAKQVTVAITHSNVFSRTIRIHSETTACHNLVCKLVLFQEYKFYLQSLFSQKKGAVSCSHCRLQPSFNEKSCNFFIFNRREPLIVFEKWRLYKVILTYMEISKRRRVLSQCPTTSDVGPHNCNYQIWQRICDTDCRRYRKIAIGDK